MSTAIASIAALVPSLLLISLIALRDPKRLRNRPGVDSALARAVQWTPAKRRVATGLALLPAVPLIAVGAWPALLIWLGALLAIGWLWVNVLAPA
jgi:hypothetical protein